MTAGNERDRARSAHTVRAGNRAAGPAERAGPVMRPGHPRRQAVLLPGHGAAGHDHRDSDPGRPGTAPGSLGDTGSVMPALTCAGRLQSYRSETPGTRVGPAAGWDGKAPGRAARDAADHARLTSRRSGVSCCGVQHGESGTGQPLDGGQGPGRARRPVDNGEPRSLPTGRTPVRRDGRALSRRCAFCAVIHQVKAFTGRRAPSRPAAAGPGRRGTLL
jgi:hypothetical protein